MIFEIVKKDKNTNARVGVLKTLHGEINTPVFMPVASSGCVKTLTVNELQDLGVEAIISNIYHLYLQPGIDAISHTGGIHNFISWDRPIFTDSGGFQVYSMPNLREVNENGVIFRSHIDGSRHFFTPENVIDYQIKIGADVITCIDECLDYPAEYDVAKKAVEWTISWAKRCKRQYLMKETSSLIFGIVQGSVYEDLRIKCTDELLKIDFDGYAIGGLSVGEPKEETYRIANIVKSRLPEDKIIHAMGLGTSEDILNLVELGVDIFDCVIPTRNGRNGQVFTSNGKLNIKNSIYQKDTTPLDENCSCYTCRTYTKAYLHHLFHIGEIVGLKLLTLHNLYFFVRLTKEIQKSIMEDRFLEFKNNFYKK